jgi:BirA family biotin operon repressor/biotin-[acetyl-CoA-carboxylase] ligase
MNKRIKIAISEAICLPRVDSTQQVLKQMLAAGTAVAGSIVVADEQSSGRGTAGNTWESEKGANLLFSFAWEPTFLPVASQFLITKAVSLAVVDFVRLYVDAANVTIKWPNDIYINNKKISGILIENSIMGGQFQHTVVGIGLNINQLKFSPALPNPVSVSQLTGAAYDLKLLIQQICAFLDERYVQLQHQQDLLHREYLLHLYQCGVFAEYLLADQRITASITGVNPYGMLQLVEKGGLRHECDMKSIRFILHE